MNRTTRLILIALFSIGFIVYAFNLGNPLFWDDSDWIIANPFVHELSWENTKFLFSHDILAGIGQVSNYYRPVLSLSFAFNWAFGGDTAWGYHLVSNGLHIGSAILIFLLLSALLRNSYLETRTSKFAAALAALFWLVHPLNTEAVTYISGRGDPLSVFLMLIALSCWLIGRGRWPQYVSSRALWWQIGGVLAGVLALLSRETAVLLPVYMTLFLVAFVFVRDGFFRSIAKSLKEVWPFYALSFIYGILRLTSLNFDNTLNWHVSSNVYSESILIRIWTFMGALFEYVRLTFVPVGLHMERNVEVLTSPLLWPVPLVVFLLILLLTQIYRAWHKSNRLWFFAAGWFFVALAPASGIAAPINALIYEHWLYMPLIGVAVLVGYYAEKLYFLAVARFRALGRMVVVFGIIYMAFLGTQAVRRNIIWGQTEKFYLQILSYEPDNNRVLNNIANWYADDAQPDKAEEYWLRAIDVDPSHPAPYHNLGNLARDRGQLAQAERLYLEAIKKKETFHHSYRNLSTIYLEQQRYQEALNLLLVLEELTPSDVAVHYAVAQLYHAANRDDLARAALERGTPYLNDIQAISAYEELLKQIQ